MDFEQIISMTPVSVDRAIGSGISYFINQQEPENVEFVKGTNGYAIRVETDEENAEEARQFWEEVVDPKL